MTVLLEQTWVDVCGYDDLPPERGQRVLVGRSHVAVFRTFGGEVHAIAAVDPFSGASVLSRGIVGTEGGAAVRGVPDVQAALRPAVRGVPRRPDRQRADLPDRGRRRSGAGRRPVTSAALAATTAPAVDLAGFTVAITAARRSEELAALLERRGAEVVSAPAIRIVPLEDDSDLLAATVACVEAPPDVTVVTTGIGFRGWMEAADGWGLGDDLRAALATGRLLARGPKARGAIRAGGLREEWSPASESMSELLDHLLDQGVAGLRVAVQLHGEPLTDFADALTSAGAVVVAVPVYRWVAPEDVRPLERLVDLVTAARVDAVVFTSAPAVTSLLRCADERGAGPRLREALGTDVLAACVGPVCAAPLDRLGIPSVRPERGRLGSLVRTIGAELPGRRHEIRVGGRKVELRGRGAVVDGRFIEIPPVPHAALRALLARPGRVLSRRQLLAALPGDGDNEHVVEMAVGRLRRLTGDPSLVRTVVRRGYQIPVDG